MRPLAPMTKTDCLVIGELTPVHFADLVSKATIDVDRESTRAISFFRRNCGRAKFLFSILSRQNLDFKLLFLTLNGKFKSST